MILLHGRLRQAATATALIPPRRLEAAKRVLEKIKERKQNETTLGQITVDEAKALFMSLQPTEEDSECRCVCGYREHHFLITTIVQL